MAQLASRAETEPGVRLRLATEFQLQIGDRHIGVPHGVQRLLAFLAIARQPVHRSRVAGQLWPDVAEWRALGNLRSVLWRLRQVRSRAVRSVGDRLSLDPAVRVDIRELTELSTHLLDEVDGPSLRRLPELVEASDILPGWEEEWLVIERERFRELRLRALERACEAMIVRGDTRHGVQACLAAVEAEPFRESAQRLLVRMHLSEGNRAAALRSYLAFRDLVEHELGIEPSDLMDDLVAGFDRPAAARNTPH
jgi:DNA-binding SARP family transcriptional activator